MADDMAIGAIGDKPKEVQSTTSQPSTAGVQDAGSTTKTDKAATTDPAAKTDETDKVDINKDKKTDGADDTKKTEEDKKAKEEQDKQKQKEIDDLKKQVDQLKQLVDQMKSQQAQKQDAQPQQSQQKPEQAGGGSPSQAAQPANQAAQTQTLDQKIQDDCMKIMEQKMQEIAGAEQGATQGKQAQGVAPTQAVQGNKPMEGVGQIDGQQNTLSGVQGNQKPGSTDMVNQLQQDMNEAQKQESQNGGQSVISDQTKQMANMTLQMAGVGTDQASQQGNAMFGNVKQVTG